MGDTSPAERLSCDRTEEPIPMSVLVVRGRSALLRTGRLTPYAVELMAESAWQAGNDAALVVTVGTTTNAAGVARLSSRLDRLRERGMHVQVTREDDMAWSPWPAARTVRR